MFTVLVDGFCVQSVAQRQEEIRKAATPPILDFTPDSPKLPTP